ncbi:transcriptional repressor LexA [Rubrobacter marinus]|uniref:transcriptional repressor LexA n=1 Tax=Rubrobacter marinus TaxID=2653852 RepID=UPI0014084AC4
MKILEVLARASREGGGVPAEREIGHAVGLKSSQTVHHHLLALEKDGYVERGEAPSRKRRPVRITAKGWEAVGKVPLLGRIAAGRGLEAVPTEDEAYSLPSELLVTGNGKRRYLLRSVGDSMVGARIEDGDMLLVEEDEEPSDGDVVVALLRGGDEVTVKRLYREGETVRLKPRNGDHEDILVPADEVRVQGRVVLVVHPPRK